MSKTRKLTGPRFVDHPSKRRRKKQIKIKAPNKLPQAAPAPDIDGVRDGKHFARICEFVQIEEGGSLPAYEAIFGLGPIERLLSSNFVERERVKADLIEAIAKLAAEQGMEMGLVTQSLGCCSGSDARVNVAAARRKADAYDSSGASSISVVAFEGWPDRDDALGFSMKVKVRTLLFGQNIANDVQRLIAAKAGKKSASATSAPLIAWLDVDDAKIASKVVKALFGLVPNPEAKDQARALGIQDWKENRGLRDFVQLQMLSMLPMSKMVMMQGRGRVILGAALKAAEERLKASMRRKRAAVPRDGMPHFWFRELRRLELNVLYVPLLEL